MREHLVACDLEALTELHCGAGDDLLQLGLALKQRQAAQVSPIQIKHVKCHEHDLG
jgi:hypothetical protein